MQEFTSERKPKKYMRLERFLLVRAEVFVAGVEMAHNAERGTGHGAAFTGWASICEPVLGEVRVSNIEQPCGAAIGTLYRGGKSLATGRGMAR